MVRLAIIPALLLAAVSVTPAAAKDSCAHGKGTANRTISGFGIKLAPHPDPEHPEDVECEASISDANHKLIFDEHDWGFSIALAGEDVNGEAIPDVVLEAYSGGAHCCWTYYIISLGSKPGLIKKFENQRDASFYRNNKSGRMEVATLDGAFDYFDGLCHACTPFPRVYLRLDGRRLTDISAQHLADYDAIIAENQKALSAPELQRLRAVKDEPSDKGASETMQKALTIVLAYLTADGRHRPAKHFRTCGLPLIKTESGS